MMMLASDISETWFNPAFVVSFAWSEYGSLTLQMVNGKEVIVPRDRTEEVYEFLTKDAEA